MEDNGKSSSEGEQEVSPPKAVTQVKEDGKGNAQSEDGEAEEEKLGCLASIYSCITPKAVLGLFIFLVMFLGFYFVIIFGYLDEFRVVVTSLGVGAYFIFILIFLLAAQPFGWGWSATTITIGFIYGWPGLILQQIGTQLGGMLCFFEIKYCGRECFKAKVDRMQPRLQLIVKKLESMATKHWKTAIPFMFGVRQMPIATWGIVNSMFAITPVSVFRYYITLVLGMAIGSPIYINLGILLRQAEEFGRAREEINGTAVNVTDAEKAVQAQQAFLQQLQFGISITVTVIILLASVAYGRYLMKQIDEWDEEQLLREIETLDNEPTGML